MEVDREVGRISSGRLGALAAVVLFILLGWSDKHYWDEYFYLYSVFVHSPVQLVRYEVQAALFPVGFFSEKIGHVVLLDLLTRILGAGIGVLRIIQLIYLLFLLGFFAAAYGLVRELLGRRLARDSTLVLMFSPPRTVPGVQGDVRGADCLLFVTLASWAFVAAFREAPRRRTLVLLGLASATLALAMLTRITMVIGFAGLGAALLLAGDERFERKQLVIRGLAVGIVAVLIHTAGLALAGGSALRFGAHIANVVSTHPPLQRVYAIALFVQTFGLAIPFAWKQRRTPGLPLTVIWLVASALPFLAGHEPRYYASAMVPLAVLTAMGLRAAGELLFGSPTRYGWIGLLAALVLANRLLLSPLMPYEVDQSDLLQLFDSAQRRAPGATFLIPWISDYSLLRFSYPAAHIELCLSRSPEGRHFTPGTEGPISKPDQWWAGEGRYLGSHASLLREDRPWFYVGWTFNPSAISLQRLLRSLKLRSLLQKGPRLHNHLAGSWVWHDQSLTLTPRDHLGRYYLYQVIPLHRR